VMGFVLCPQRHARPVLAGWPWVWLRAQKQPCSSEERLWISKKALHSWGALLPCNGVNHRSHPPWKMHSLTQLASPSLVLKQLSFNMLIFKTMCVPGRQEYTNVPRPTIVWRTINSSQVTNITRWQWI
jgi:hypothetical protein